MVLIWRYYAGDLRIHAVNNRFLSCSIFNFCLCRSCRTKNWRDNFQLEKNYMEDLQNRLPRPRRWFVIFIFILVSWVICTSCCELKTTNKSEFNISWVLLLYQQWLMPSEGGYLEAEGIEKTWRIRQEDIAREVDVSSSRNQFDITLPSP